MMMMLTLGLSAAMVAPPTAMDHYQRGVDHFAAGKARRAAACIRRSLKLEITPITLQEAEKPCSQTSSR